MFYSRRKSVFFVGTLLLISLASVPIVLTWRDFRQHQLDRLLTNAIKQDDTQQAILALNRGANGNAEIPDEDTPPISFVTLLRARFTGKSVAIASGTPSLLAVLGIGATVWRPAGQTEPAPSLPKENPALVQSLLVHGADVNVRGENNLTPLLLALRWRFESVAKLLIDRGANVNQPDINGITPLMEAVAGHSPVSLRTLGVLIAHDAHVNDQDIDGKTALIHAIAHAKENNVDFINYILQHHAQVDTQDHNGKTALVYAVENLDTDAVACLIKNNANANINSEDGKPLYYAYHNTDNLRNPKLAIAHAAIIVLLKRAGAKE